MPLILHDYAGLGHDLSKGAFDSVSIAKPGAASHYLSQYIPQQFQDSWRELSTDYRTTLKSYQPSMWSKMWSSIGTQGLLAMVQKGASKYKFARPVIYKWIAGIASADPTIGAVVAAAEVGLGTLLDTWGDQAGNKTIRAKKGQWIFIESLESYRRRALGKLMTPGGETEAVGKHKIKLDIKHDPSHLSEKIIDVSKPPKSAKKSVSLGFFIEPTTKNRVSVFSVELGRAIEIEVSQLLECDSAVAKRLDSDERLSTLRELYFYKYDGMAPTKSAVMSKPFFPGKRVRYKGASYILLLNKHGKALLEDGNGKTLVVDTILLKRDYGDSTPGKYDNGFGPAGKNNLYIGQWVFVPARPETRFRFDAEVELGVINQVCPENRCYVYLAIDGAIDTVEDDDIQPLNKQFQELYNAKKTFSLFRQAAIGGSWATERFALGKSDITVCVGKDYSDALTVETPYAKALEDYARTGETPGKDVGNNKKAEVDYNEMMRNKGVSAKDLNQPSDIRYEKEYSTVNGTVVIGLAIVALAYAFLAA